MSNSTEQCAGALIEHHSSRRQFIKRLGGTLCLLVLMVGVFSAWATLRFGAIRAGIAYVAGEPVFVDRDVIDFSTMKEGEHYTASFSVRNLSSGNIRLIGSKSSCSCAVVEGIPTVIEPGETTMARVRLHPRVASKPISESIDLYTDNSEGRTIRIRIRGTVVSR
jgi:hypothetical protein